MAEESSDLGDELPDLALGEQSSVCEGREGRQNLSDDEFLRI
jgi:hypothetical protein